MNNKSTYLKLNFTPFNQLMHMTVCTMYALVNYHNSNLVVDTEMSIKHVKFCTY